ncbi:MAG: phosphoribosylamine--glycine ligase [Clostridia bacterium]|nr:phosphoribosylamine--glycine ligase [Clostridia bacterium]
MKVLVIGGGGREHAVVKALKTSPEITELYCLPGNGGIAMDATCVAGNPLDLDAVCAFAKAHEIGYAVVTPDDPLAAGLVDRLEAIGIPCFGPRQNAAVIESSKVFAKHLMAKYGIPTARCEVFDNYDSAVAYLKEAPAPIVVKADGLALGKGVIIAETREQAIEAVSDMMLSHRFGASGDRVVIEEFLEGPEVSVLAFTDGKTLVPMVASMDHKRALDGDKGLNTGGMGVIAPNPFYTEDVAKACMETIFLPTIRAMEKEGRPFRGCLYFGLMITKDGPKVIEYNCRFGDPETQVVLPLLKSDLFTVMRATTFGTLDTTEVTFSRDAACCVVLASQGYPGSYEKGKVIDIPQSVRDHVYVAGAALKDGALVTSGGRVLGCTATAPTLKEAVDAAYEIASHITFEGAHMRHDIGARALRAARE